MLTEDERRILTGSEFKQRGPAALSTIPDGSWNVIVSYILIIIKIRKCMLL
jgi:hypothetical protein